MSNNDYMLCPTTQATVRFLIDRLLVKARGRCNDLFQITQRPGIALRTAERDICPAGRVINIPECDGNKDRFTWILVIATPKKVLVNIYFNDLGECLVEQKTGGFGWVRCEMLALLVSYVNAY